MKQSKTIPTAEDVASAAGGDVDTAKEALRAVRFNDE